MNAQTRISAYCCNTNGVRHEQTVLNTTHSIEVLTDSSPSFRISFDPEKFLTLHWCFCYHYISKVSPILWEPLILQICIVPLLILGLWIIWLVWVIVGWPVDQKRPIINNMIKYLARWAKQYSCAACWKCPLWLISLI